MKIHKALLLMFVFVVVIAFAGRIYIGAFIYNFLEDSKSYGWEVKRNSEHVRPNIPEKAKSIVPKYNGIYSGDEGRKAVYLTIDLGYESGNTCAILDVLKANGIKSTFFIVSSYLKKNPDIVGRIVSEGHMLGNHTVNYKHLDTLGDYQVEREIMDLHNDIKDRYGIDMKYLRTPYEEWSERVLKITDRLGYKTIFWSVACIDWVEKDPDYIYKSVMDNYHNGAIILLHGVSKGSPVAIDMIIKDLKAKGYEFRILDM